MIGMINYHDRSAGDDGEDEFVDYLDTYVLQS